jgi:hypothetical protein
MPLVLLLLYHTVIRNKCGQSIDARISCSRLFSSAWRILPRQGTMVPLTANFIYRFIFPSSGFPPQARHYSITFLTKCIILQTILLGLQ